MIAMLPDTLFLDAALIIGIVGFISAGLFMSAGIAAKIVSKKRR